MKLKFTVFITLLIYTFGFTQTDTTTVPFVSYWSKGDSYNFKVTKIKKQWREGLLSKNDSSSYVVNFEIIDSTATSYRIKWTYKTNLNELGIPPALIPQFSAYETTEVIYKTSELGEFIAIENWEEIAKMMKSIFTELIDFVAKENGISKESVEQMMKPVKDIYETQQGIEQVAFKELQFFHFPFGVEYSINEPILYEEELPNMFGGKPIRGDAKLYFETLNVEDASCVLIQEMQLNPEDTRNLITALFKQMQISNNDMEAKMKTAQFDIKDYNRFEYYYDPGIPIKVETNRESIIKIAGENGKRVDIIRIELMD